MIWLITLAAIWLILAMVKECYNLQVANSRLLIVQQLLFTALEAGLLYVLAVFAFGHTFVLASPYAPPHLIPVLFLLVSLPLLALWRVGYAQLFTSAPMRRRAIIVGAGSAGRALIGALGTSPQDYELIGIVDDDPAKQGQRVHGLAVLGTRENLLRLVHAKKADEVILAITGRLHDDLFRGLMACYEQGVDIKPMPLFYEEVLGRVPVEHLGQHWFVGRFHANPPTPYRTLKRFMDIMLALVGLSVLAVIFPFVAAAIYLDSPGPIFYQQERLGRAGRSFRVIKFRSMVPNAERRGQAVWATRRDRRITRVGIFLRRTRLDEFPQFINILKGEMSIVGPRPERPQFVAQLQEQIPFYRTRLSVKPGLTGWGQIKYGYGSSVEDALMKLQYDLYYIKHRSLTLDMLVILRTIKVMLAFKGT